MADCWISCSGKARDAGRDEPYSPTYTHEEIGSYVHRSGLMGGEEAVTKAEGEWAQSEVGEGVEELWERAVRFSYLVLPRWTEIRGTG